jgi:hypothetical protein
MAATVYKIAFQVVDILPATITNTKTPKTNIKIYKYGSHLISLRIICM